MEENEQKEDLKNPVITHETAEELDNTFDVKERETEEKVEAALFIAGKYMSLQELIMLTDVNPIMLKEILRKLEKRYEKRAVKIVNREQTWKMDVAERYNYLVNKLATGSTEFTKAEQETLAVIAHKQPVKQSVIIRIRGNKAYDHVRKFVETGLVQAKRMGHTNELNLSEDFYNYFNVMKKSAEAE